MSANYEEFAKTLVAWRLSRGWTQDDLASRSGISKSAVSQIERGSNNAMPKDITLSKLANAFGVPIAILLKDPDTELIQKMKERAHNLRVVDAGEVMDTSAGSAHVVISDSDSPVVRIKRLSCAPSSTPEAMLFEAACLSACVQDYDMTQLRVWEIVDDTMAPTLIRRDIALVVPIRDGLFQGNGVYVVRYGNTCEPRRVISSMDGGLRVSLDNPLCKETPLSLSASDLRAEARIVFAFSGRRIF